MAGKQRYTREQVKQALESCNGLVFLAAKKLGCTSATVINYQHRYQSIRAAVLERRGERVDIGEAMLDKAVLAGEAWAIALLLKTIGKDRGYIERTEQDNHTRIDVVNWDTLAQAIPDGPVQDVIEAEIVKAIEYKPEVNGKHEGNGHVP